MVGGYVRKERSISIYSGEGPSNNPKRRGPDVAAPTDDSLIHGGIRGTGNKSGSTLFLDGTSIAAAHITRRIANLMADGKQTSRAAIYKLARDHEDKARADAIQQRPMTATLSQDDLDALTKKHRYPPEERAGGGRLPAVTQNPIARIEID